MTQGPNRVVAGVLLATLTASAPTLAAQPIQPPTPTPTQEAPAANEEDDAEDMIRLINREASEEGIFAFDWGVPSSPALKLLGQPEDKVTVVNGLKPLILQLPRLLGGDEGGQSLGVDLAPAWLLGDRTNSFDTYTKRGNRLYRILHRTHVGAGFYEGIADDDAAKAKPSRLTVGISTSLLDRNDLLMARDRRADGTPIGWRPCLERNSRAVASAYRNIRFQAESQGPALLKEQEALEPRHRVLKPKNDAGTLTLDEKAEFALIERRLLEIHQAISEIRGRLSAAFKTQYMDSEAAKAMAACPKEANVVAQYGASLNVGLGALWDGVPGKLRGFSSSGFVGWASFRLPFASSFVLDEGELRPGSYWMIGFSARASVDELVATGIEATPQVRANVFDGWAGLERLSPTSRLGLQLGYQMRDSEGRLADFDRRRWRYFASYSQRLGGRKSGTWLQVGYGHVRSSDDDDEALSVSLIFAPPSPANLFGTN